MSKLSPRQADVLAYIESRCGKGKIPPTLEEIRDHFGWRAIGTVQDHVRALIGKGALRRGRGARTLQPVLSSPKLLRVASDGLAPDRIGLVPVIGAVAAGQPVLAVEHRQDEWYFDRRFLKGDNNFLLRVEGESMIGAQIRDGDYVLIRPQSHAENGEIVVARIGEEVTVKRFYRSRDRLELRPENPGCRSFVYREGDEEVELVGKVIGVIRRY